MDGQDRKCGRHRALWWLGVGMLLVSVLAFLASAAIPGVAWVVGMVALIVLSAVARYAGKAFAILGVVVSTIHLFLFGPLSLSIFLHRPGNLALPPLGVLLLLVALPFGVALLAICWPQRTVPPRAEPT